MDEELHRLRIHPVVTDLFSRIFGEPALAHPMFVQRNIFPHTGSFDFTTGMHQDRVHIGGATSYALWMPLGDCPREKGALAVEAGSHRQGILDTKVGSGAGGMDIAVPIPGAWVTGAFKAGDALIFQDVTVHKALANRTCEIRMSFDARFQPVSQPIADVNMVPYAGCGAWEEVYAGWERTDGQYFWNDLTLNIVPLDRSHYERRDAMAFEMAELGDREARDAILRIFQRDPSEEKLARAESCSNGSTRSEQQRRDPNRERAEHERTGWSEQIPERRRHRPGTTQAAGNYHARRRHAPDRADCRDGWQGEARHADNRSGGVSGICVARAVDGHPR